MDEVLARILEMFGDEFSEEEEALLLDENSELRQCTICGRFMNKGMINEVSMGDRGRGDTGKGHE